MRAPVSAKKPSPSLAVVVFSFLLIVAGLYFGQFRKRAAVPDETAAGLELLAAKFAQKGYFHLAEMTDAAHEARHRYWFSTTNAEAQVDRVLAERGLAASHGAELRSLIQQLAEPSKSRAAGEASVNMLRLNLALDEKFPSQPVLR